MIWRWLIRTLCLALLTLCVTAWVGSAFFYLSAHRLAPHRMTNVFLGGGEISWADNEGMEAEMLYRRDQDLGRVTGHDFLGWNFSSRRYEGPFHWIDKIPGGYHLGVVAIHTSPPPFTNRHVTMPVWFPTLLSALLLWFVWRKTRRQHIGKGFPVEPIAKESNNP